MSTSLRVGVIGLGNIGSAMADRVVAAGYRVRVYDLADDAVAARVALGADRAVSPADAARNADVVSIIVFDGGQVHEVLHGADGVLAAARPGTIIAIHTTVAPRIITTMAAAAERRGMRLIDAGVSGGASGARQGTLVTMVGGSSDAFLDAKPVFDAFSKEVIHVGPTGSGMALKVARNLVGYLATVAGHEAITMAGAAGVNTDLLEHVLRATDAGSQLYYAFSVLTDAPFGVDDEVEQHSLKRHLWRLADKDLGCAEDAAGAASLDLPLVGAARRTFRAAIHLQD
jgi:3-hydroxyisobutyrate dehydrogenase-like beta-hydroxyacid dehydrogenase